MHYDFEKAYAVHTDRITLIPNITGYKLNIHSHIFIQMNTRINTSLNYSLLRFIFFAHCTLEFFEWTNESRSYKLYLEIPKPQTFFIAFYLYLLWVVVNLGGSVFESLIGAFVCALFALHSFFYKNQ